MFLLSWVRKSRPSLNLYQNKLQEYDDYFFDSESLDISSLGRLFSFLTLVSSREEYGPSTRDILRLIENPCKYNKYTSSVIRVGTPKVDLAFYILPTFFIRCSDRTPSGSTDLLLRHVFSTKN